MVRKEAGTFQAHERTKTERCSVTYFLTLLRFRFRVIGNMLRVREVVGMAVLPLRVLVLLVLLLEVVFVFLLFQLVDIFRIGVAHRPEIRGWNGLRPCQCTEGKRE